MFLRINSRLRMVLLLLFCVFNTYVTKQVDAQLIINEINYSVKNSDGVEDVGEEWIEFYNPGPQQVSLKGWAISSGVDFRFPDIVMDPDSFIVVSADPIKFSLSYPDAPAVLGPWIGKLSNNGESIELRDSDNKKIDQVNYADEGFWALRKPGPDDLGHQGWVWDAMHDGMGMTLELINWFDENNNGHNWSSSISTGGTPGFRNSVYDPKLLPLIKSIEHFPVIPKSTESVLITLKIDNDSEIDNIRPKLFWRVDGSEGAFNSIVMIPGEIGGYFAEVPKQKDKAVVEFFFEVSSEFNKTLVWPNPITDRGNVCNYLYMVDDDYKPTNSKPSYYVVMTEDEKDELEEIGRRSSQSDSNAEMNCTFISFDGKGYRVRYLSSIRNRGASSRNGPPNNHLIKFRSDDTWNGQDSIKFNCQFIHSQVAGSWLYQWLGIQAADSIAVKLHVNGEDLAESDGPRMFGHYARTESLDSNFASAHWPSDPNGNLYQVRDDESNGDEGDLKYEGEQAVSYKNTYFKKTNESDDDWTDIISLTRNLNRSNEPDYIDQLSEVIDIDQWLRFLAVDSLVGNREGGLTTGKGDDYALYRGVNDQRFKLVPHDLDTVLDQGTRSGNPNLSVFTYKDVDGLEEFLSHPEIIPKYYAQLLSIINNKYKPEKINPIIDRALGEMIPSDVLDEMKEFIVDRRRGVLSQIQTNYSVNVDLAKTAEGYYRSTNGEAKFAGEFHVAEVGFIKVNGEDANLDRVAGDWDLTLRSFSNGGVLLPGLNRVRVTFYGTSGTNILYEEYIKLWNDNGEVTTVSGELRGNDFRGNVNLTTRSSYIPNVPFLVRVDLRNENGEFLREVWNDTAILSTDRLGVRISPNIVKLRNGLGSVLVNIEGGGDEEKNVLIQEGGIWSYLDDGSDQGDTWKNINFDDSGWEKGRAEFGYGDGDEVTEVSYGASSRNKHATTYFRSEFNVESIENISSLEMSLKYDDGAIVYINGKEFFKSSNMASSMKYDDYTIDGEDTPSEDFQEFSKLSPELIVQGKNVIAVEIKQGDDRSSDISFDLKLGALISGPSVDPGDINLNVTMDQGKVTKKITSLGATPEITLVSGVLDEVETNWSGIIRINEDLIVPKGHVLNISPGTIILLDGDSEPQSEGGSDLIILGSLNCVGSRDDPITFTSSLNGNIWGQILFEGSESAVLKYTNIHRAGHSPKGGHTDHGRVLRVLGSNVVFEDCTISDNRGKIGQSNSLNDQNSELIFRRCHWARSVMGMETFDTGVLLEDSYITDMLGEYREDGVTDDNDAIYLHEAGSGQKLILNRLTVAFIDDDGIDTLGAVIAANDVICRDCSDKGISVFGGTFNLMKGILANNSIGISAKDDAEVFIENVTISENDLVGLQVENKDGNDQASKYSINNSIIWGNPLSVRTDYSEDDIVITESIIEGGWSENLNQNPLFRDPNSGDFRLSIDSPGIQEDLGNSIIKDLGFYEYKPAGGEVLWRLDQSPYHVIDDVKIPKGIIFNIEAGVSIYVNEGVVIEIEGRASIIGTPDRRIQFSHYPGSQFVKDDAGNGTLPEAPPKWKGLKLINSLDPDNLVMLTDFDSAQDDEGAIGVIKSQCVIDDVSFSRTHIRMIYTEDASVIIRNTKFPDMFAEDEKPAELGLDNISEHIKGVGEIPEGGRYIIKNNYFGINKGHNDVIDVDSGWRPNPIVQIIGNYFSGAGDELCDLGGDVFLSENIFLNVFKDDETSDRGYANAISTGDVGPGATFSVSRNVFADIDHAISLKIQSATIFENNTVYKVHPDFIDRFDNPSVASVVNLFIPTDTDSRATHGKGAFLADNILVTPRVFSGADDAKEPPYPVTPLEMVGNLLDPQLLDLEIGRNHENLTVLDLGKGNFVEPPLFVNPDQLNFTLEPTSPAINAGRYGQDLGAMVASGIFITGEPAAVTTDAKAAITVGGPGYFAYRWRIVDQDWSNVIQIGNGFDVQGNTVRNGLILLDDLRPGVYQVEVIGQDFAGNWQEVPTKSEKWNVVEGYSNQLILNEILILNGGVYNSQNSNPSYIEIYNAGPDKINLKNCYLTTNILGDRRLYLDQYSEIEGWEYLVVEIDSLISKNDQFNSTGSFFLYCLNELTDSIDYGYQILDYSIGRHGRDSLWSLNIPTPGNRNIGVSTGDISGVRINEWLANTNDSNDVEFIELYNTNAFPINLTNGVLSDSSFNGGDSLIFPTLSYIAPNGYLSVTPDGFRLSSDFDQILLFDQSGLLIDDIIYGPQTEGVSEGIAQKGESYKKFLIPTPGIRNPALGSEEYQQYEMSLKIYDSLRITEIMYNPLGGSKYEFIELQNIGDESIDLDGVKFIQGIDFIFNEVVIAPKETVVLVSDYESFIARYGEMDHLIYEYEGRLNNAGEVLSVQFPHPFPFKFINFSFEDEWYQQTDGRGYSLEIFDLGVGATKYNERESWVIGDYLGTPHGISLQQNYETWTDQNLFGNPYEDFDGDGLVNGLEYLIGGNIDKHDQIPLPKIEHDSSSISWEISTSLVVSDYRIIAESSDDLKVWNEINPDELIVDSLKKNYTYRISDSLNRTFLRLRLEKVFP